MIQQGMYLAKFQVNLSEPAAAQATVDYETVGGTAISGDDFEPASGTLVFEIGEQTKTVSVTTRSVYSGDPAAFKLHLSNPVNCSITRVDGDAAIPGRPRAVVFYDTFTGDDDTSLLAHNPEIGGPWEDLGYDEGAPAPELWQGSLQGRYDDIINATAPFAPVSAEAYESLVAKLKLSNFQSTIETAADTSFSLNITSENGNEWRNLNIYPFQPLVQLDGNMPISRVEANFGMGDGTVPVEIELRWNLRTGTVGIYIDDVWIVGAAGLPITHPITNFNIYASGMSSAKVDYVEFVGGGLLPQYVDNTPPPPEPLLAWYAKGADWSGTSAIAADGVEVGSYPNNWFTGRVLDEPAGVITWRREWYPVDTSEAPAFMAPRGPLPTDPTGGAQGYAWGMSVDPSTLWGSGHGELRMYAAVDGVELAGYLYLTFSDGDQAYSDTAWGYVSTEASMHHIRDDFNGSGLLAARVPNVSTTGGTWNNIAEAPDAHFELNGGGTLRSIAGAEGSNISYAMLDLPASTTAKVEFIIRSTAGGGLIAHNDHVFRAELSLGGNNGKAWLDEGWAYVSSSNTGTADASVAVMPGAAGAPLKVTIEWANGSVLMRFNDGAPLVSIATASGEYPGAPDGAGNLYFEMTAGNQIEFLDIELTPLTGV